MTPDNDSSPRAVRRVRADARASRDHLACAALAAEARRVPPDAVAAGQPVARRARSTSHYQGASFRFYHQASATERGALFNPDYNLEELDFLRAHTPDGGVFVDVGANVGTYAMVLARHVGASGEVIAIEPHPVTHARLAFNRAASGYRTGEARGRGRRCFRRRIDDRDRRRQSRRQPYRRQATRAGNAIKVPSLRLQRILDEAGVSQVDALKIDVEGYEDRVLTGFFRDARQALWPRAVVIEHLSRNEWLRRLHRRHARARLRGDRQTRSNTLLVRAQS